MTALAVLVCLLAPQRIAVLELRNPASLPAHETAYLTDRVRAAALQLPHERFFVLTRENLVEHLPPGVDLAACEGACEVETGRNVGADYVLTGEVIRFGDSLRVLMKLHDTKAGRLLGNERASGPRVTALESPVEKSAAQLFSKLAGTGAAGKVGGGVVTGGTSLETGADIVNQITDDRGFLFVETEPPGATVLVNGDELGTSPVQPELAVGRYVVVARLPLHHPARKEVRLGVDGARLKLTLPPAYGRVVVESTPPGAEVWLAGAKVGVSPWRDDRRASGKYGVELRLANHLSHSGELVVEDGGAARLKVDLEPNFGALTVRSTPAGASIQLNGRDTAKTTPQTFDVLQPGAYTVKLSLAGHGDAVHRATVTRRGAARVEAELQARLGLLTVLSTTGDGKPCAGDAWVDGVSKGRTPLKLRVIEGPHEVSVRCGGGEATDRVEVAHNERARLELTIPRGAEPVRGAQLGTSGELGWARIEGGTFRMGSAEGGGDEKPVRRVRVGTFWMSRSEVTVGQYGACVKAGTCTAPKAGGSCNWTKSEREQHPVNCVDWRQASTFAKCAGGRLPSEAEWEYAARSGGKARKYPWGNDEANCARAVMNDDGKGCGRESTWPVCSKEKGHTEQGLCDMAGNVWEWVADWYGPYGEAPTDGSARTRAAQGRVNRGGGWNDTAGFLRAALRDGDLPGFLNGNLGFRVAKSGP